MARTTVLVGIILWTQLACSISRAADELPAPSDARKKDRDDWVKLLDDKNFDELETIAQSLDVRHLKYRNGSGRLPYFYEVMADGDGEDRQDEKYQDRLKVLESWLNQRPKSITARIALASFWTHYGHFTRGPQYASLTPDRQLQIFKERCTKASEYLDEIDERKDRLDAGYYQSRVFVGPGLGETPSMSFVFKGLERDPLDREIVRGMAMCLLPRWLGSDGEIEKFADEVARRTSSKAGDLHYLDVALTAYRHEGGMIFDRHSFDWKRIKKGFRDLERLFPQSREHLAQELQFAMFAGDLTDACDAVKKLSSAPVVATDWYTNEFDKYRLRMQPAMLQGDQKRTLAGHVAPIVKMELIGDGKTIASIDDTGVLRVFDLALSKGRGGGGLGDVAPQSVSIQPAPGSLSAAGYKQQPGILLINSRTYESSELKSSDQIVVATTFSATGQMLASADASGKIVIFDLKTKKPKQEFAAVNQREIQCLVFSPKNETLAAVTRTETVLIFDLKGGKPETEIALPGRNLQSASWSKDGKRLAIGDTVGTITVHEWPGQTEIAKTQVEPAIVESLDFSPSGDKLAIGVRQEPIDALIKAPVYIWAYRKEDAPKPLQGHQMSVNVVRFNAKGTSLFTASADWTIRMWDVP